MVRFIELTITKKHISIILIIFFLLSLPAAGYSISSYFFYETSCNMNNTSCCNNENSNCCSFALPEKADEFVDFFSPEFADPILVQEIILQTPVVQNIINSSIASVTIVVLSTNNNPILRC